MNKKDLSAGVWTSGSQIRLCSDRGICPYRLARNAAQDAPINVMNLKAYFVWNLLARESEYFKPRSFMVFDECHTIEDMARDFFESKISDKSINNVLYSVLGEKPGGGRYAEFRTGNNVDQTIHDLFGWTSKALMEDMKQSGMEKKFDAYAEWAAECGEKVHLQSSSGTTRT